MRSNLRSWTHEIAARVIQIKMLGGSRYNHVMLVADPYAWFAGAAIGWLIAFAPWAARLLQSR